jgi:dipeptidyl aminopeptidase/acylaminoacyl peptidase
MSRPATNILRALVVTTALVFGGLTLTAADPAPTAQPTAQAPTLEQLYPKDGLVGDPALRVAYGHDGKYAAYLHRDELVILDSATNVPFRAVTAQTLASFRNADKDTPQQFHGVFAYAWSPRGHELLFLCEGHVYRYDVPGKQITRLTQQRMPAWQGFWSASPGYLPDGSGYLVTRRSFRFPMTVWQGTFATGEFKPWAPKLPAGERLQSLTVSPDGQSVVLTTRRGPDPMQSQREIKVANYRDRFLQVQLAPWRTVAGDPLPDIRISLFVAPLAGAADSVTCIYSYTLTARPDVVSSPNWSPDGSKLAFARYSHAKREFEILEVAMAERAINGPGLSAQQARVVYAFEYTGGPSRPPMLQPWYLADNRHLVYVSEQTGFLQLHTLDTVTGRAASLTSGNFEVYPITLSQDRTAVYVAATKEHATRRDLYRVDAVDGHMERLTAGPGVYGLAAMTGITSTAFSPDGKNALAMYATFGTLPELVHIDVATGKQHTLTSSHLPQAQRLATARPEFFSYTNRHGDEIHGYVFKPTGWQKTDKRPALIYVYGGPMGIHKVVMDGEVTGDYLFAHYMAEKHGYVTVMIDPRGSSGYGARFEDANYGRPGQPQVEDLEDGVQFLVDHYGVDAKRVGLHGWSFGGFTTQMCMYTSDKFAVGISGAGPTEWHNYNDWYTSNTIGGLRKLRQFSLVPLAANLQGRLLLVHGMEDDNVLVQDTIHVYRALLQAGKGAQVELFLDPTGHHLLMGDVWELQKYRKYEQFLVQHLGSAR